MFPHAPQTQKLINFRRRDGMQVQSMKNEEKLINNIMFIYILCVGIAG